MTSEEILEALATQMDGIREFDSATFELADYWIIADARLSAFSNDKMWVVAIEVVGYLMGPQEYALRVWLFGNCLQGQKSEDEFPALDDLHHTVLTTPEAWNRKIWSDENWRLARDGFALQWRGKRLDFAPSWEELSAAEIELSRREIESGELSPQQMLRFICEKLDHPFFLSEDALRDLLNERGLSFRWQWDEETRHSHYENALGNFEVEPLLGVCLELVLQTRDWIHPKVGLGDPEIDEWEISPREAFATLAQTLATRELAVWNAQDSSKFNSHWRNWAQIDADIERAEDQKIEAGKAEFRAFFAGVPTEERASFIRQVRPSIEHSPRRFYDGHVFAYWKNIKIPIFHELRDALDEIEAQMKLEQPDA